MLAQISLRYLDDDDAALKYAEKATKSNPHSAPGIEVFIATKWHAKGGNVRGKDLDHVIAEAEIALEFARQVCDFRAERLTQNCLAYFLAQRYETRKQKRATDLQDATNICRNLVRVYKLIEEVDLPAFYDTYAYVLSQSNEESVLKMALKYAKQAEKRAPESPLVAETRAKILGKLRVVRREKKSGA